VAQDYDAPRGTDDGSVTVPLDGLDPARDGARTAVMELDEPDLVDGFDLPGEDLSGLELTVEIIPVQADEFTCSSCFLSGTGPKRRGRRTDRHTASTVKAESATGQRSATTSGQDRASSPCRRRRMLRHG